MDSVRDLPGFALRQVAANGILINVATAGVGQPILLLHGWPHTWFLWRKVMASLSGDYRVIAPNLRGIGGTTRAADGYDIQTLSDDAASLLRELDAEDAVSVGIDAGAPVSWMLAMRHPEQIRKLVVMESLLGLLPGAEDFLKRGPPWWFGFHSVPGLAETVVEGHEDAYLDWFFRSGTFGGRGIEPGTPSSPPTVVGRPCGAASSTTGPGRRTISRSARSSRRGGSRCRRWRSVVMSSAIRSCASSSRSAMI